MLIAIGAYVLIVLAIWRIVWVGAQGDTDTNTAHYCYRCDTLMVEGIATTQTYVGGTPDFPNDTSASTFSAGGTGKVVNVWKCPSCGHSFTKRGERCQQGPDLAALRIERDQLQAEIDAAPVSGAAVNAKRERIDGINRTELGRNQDVRIQP